MRNIITPVKYEASESDQTNPDASHEDSLSITSGDSIELNQRSTSNCRDSRVGSVTPLTRVARHGVQVLPRAPSVRQLTQLHWQKPTDGRVAELMVSKSRSSKDSSKRSSSAQLAATRGPQIVKHQASSSRQLLNQLAKLWRLNEPNYRVRRPEKIAQVESLIEQLEQITTELNEDENLLDRADRRDWPTFSERTTEAEHSNPNPSTPDRSNLILESNFPSQSKFPFNQLDFGERVEVDPIEAEAIAKSHLFYNQRISSLASRIDSLLKEEESSISNKHLETANDPQELNQNLSKLRPSTLPDRYSDDLAVRRLAAPSSIRQTDSHDIDKSNSMKRLPVQSYLLCSSAYTPTIEPSSKTPETRENSIKSYSQDHDERLRRDDLYFRNVRKKPEVPEPPFGLPRNQYNSSSQKISSSDPRQCNCSSCISQENKCILSNLRSDSRVSFESNQRVTRTMNASGSTSADSGLHGPSPVSYLENSRHVNDQRSPLGYKDQRTSRSISRISQATTTSLDYDDIDQEVDLDKELIGVDEVAQDDTNGKNYGGHALEFYRAEYRATPTRRRPKINIQNPRAKSPLVQVSKSTTSVVKDDGPRKSDKMVGPGVVIQCYEDTISRRRNGDRCTALRAKSCDRTSEIACHYDFEDDEEDDGKDDSIETFNGQTDSRSWVKSQSFRYKTQQVNESSSLSDSSVERLHYRGGTGPRDTPKDDQKTRSPQKNALFSIGEYKPLERTNLKIL